MTLRLRKMEVGGKSGKVAALWGKKMFLVPDNELVLPSLGVQELNQEFWGSSATPNSASVHWQRILRSLKLEKIFKTIKSRCPTISRCPVENSTKSEHLAEFLVTNECLLLITAHLGAVGKTEPVGCSSGIRALIPGSGQAPYSLLADSCCLCSLTFPAQFCFGNPKLEYSSFDIKLFVALPGSLPRRCSWEPHLQATPIGFREWFEDWICLWNGFNQTIFSVTFWTLYSFQWLPWIRSIRTSDKPKIH